MFYKFNRDSLVWEKNKIKARLMVLLVIIIIFGSFVIGRYTKFNALSEYEKELMVLTLQSEKIKFSQEKLIEELKRLNVRFPHIVLAQSIVETGNFTSNIFKENNNLFGMKQASVRINTAKGTQYNHAYYDNWYESVYDYAFYQCRYLSGIDSEQMYYEYLSKSYAEAGDKYVTQIKQIIEKQNLIEKFK